MAEQIPHVISENAGDPVVATIRLGGSRAIHPCVWEGKRVDWMQHIEAAKVAAQEMAVEMVEDIHQMGKFESIDTTQPVFIEAALTKGRPGHERKIAKQHIKVDLKFSESVEEQITDQLKKLPKLLWGLRKTWANKQPDYVHFSLEFTVRVNSAPIKRVSKILEEANKEAGELGDSIIAELKKIAGARNPI